MTVDGSNKGTMESCLHCRAGTFVDFIDFHDLHSLQNRKVSSSFWVYEGLKIKKN